MKIGIDIRPLQNHNKFRGIGRHLLKLLTSLAPLLENHQVVFYAETAKPLPEEIIKLYKDSVVKTISGKKIAQLKYIRALALPYVKIKLRAREVDVFLQNDPWLGIPKNVPTIATFYDLIPMFFKINKDSLGMTGVGRYKQILGELVQEKFYKEMLDSYKNAQAILAISQSSKDDYVKYIDASAKDKIFVTLLAGSEDSFPKVTPAEKTKILKKYGLSSNRFLLFVGGIDMRKNIAGLAKDFIEVKKEFKDLKMIMVGKEFGLTRDLKNVGWTDVLKSHPLEAKDILTPGFVGDDELGTLFSEASVFAFPSKYEGFGLPILEAMHAGCPVICYANSSLPEVAGDAAIILKDGTSMAPAIKQVITDSRLRDDLIKRGKLQAKKFSWQKTAKETMKVIERVAKDSTRNA